jgi:protein kinase C substrate 80K-H
VGKEYRKRKTQEENIRRAGSKTRARYIAERKKALETLHADVAKLEVEVQVAQEREQRAKVALDAAEKMDAHVIEQKKQSPLYQTLKSHQDALRALMSKQSDMSRELERLTSLLDDLAKGYNPNYQDMAVKGAVMAYRSWRRGDDGTSDDAQEGDAADEAADEAASKLANQKPIDEEEPTTLNALRSDGDWPRSKLRDIVDADPLTLMDDDAFKMTQGESGILFRIHEYLPDAIVPYFEAAVDTVLDLLLKANIIAEVKRSKSRKSGNEAETENVTAARSVHRKAQDSLRQLEQELKRKSEDLESNPEKWGSEGEFKSLDGVCVDRNMGEYTYEFCFFKSATQKPNRGHGNVSLGRFNKFAPKDQNVKPDDPAFYHRQIYDAGQRCWNGPDRSLIVDFVCAPENALLDVFEGEKCIYEAKVSTPAVCLPLEAEKEHTMADGGGKDEL